MQLGFGTGILYGIQTQDATGAAVANATPVQFGTLQDISGDISFEEKLLYGSYQFPIAVGRGKGKLAFKAKMANLFGAVMGDLLFGLPRAAGIKSSVSNFAAAIPATPFQITVAPPSSGTFAGDLGVLNATTGLPLKKVASAPATGQYSVSGGGVYTFASADTGNTVMLSYEYTATSTTAQNGSITNQLMGYAPTFSALLTMSFQGKPLTLKLNQCVASKFSLPMKNDDFTIPEFDFSAFADGAGNIGYWATAE